jgi:hypothetical protein
LEEAKAKTVKEARLVFEDARKQAKLDREIVADDNLPKASRLASSNNLINFQNKFVLDENSQIPNITVLPDFGKEYATKLGAIDKAFEKGVVTANGASKMITELNLEFQGQFKTSGDQTREDIKETDIQRQTVQAKALGQLDPIEAGISQREIGTAQDVAASRAGLLELGKKGKKEFAPQVETSNLPVPGEPDKFQKVIIDRTTGESTPVLDTKGNPVFLNEKQVLISEGKKAQSLINPFETKFLGRLGSSEATRLTELRIKAVDSVSSKKIIQEGRDLIAQGIYTGSAANIKKSLDKWLQEANIFVGGRKAANTEAYASMMGLQVGKIIKQFGAGTGLSDADREYAENIVGGRVTLTEDAITRLLDINERLADFTIEEFNSQVSRAKTNLETKDYLQPVEIPQFGTTIPTAVKRFNPATGRIE